MLPEPKNDVMETRYRSKRRKIMENESGVITSETRRCIGEDLVPLDLVIEILRRLPSKSLTRFLLVSKSWATIIRSRDFIRSFPFQRSLLDQPPLLLALVEDLNNQNSRQIWKFFSSSSTSESVSYLSHPTCSNITSLFSEYYYVDKIPRYVNGLVSLGCGQEQIIWNPSAGKSITLPKVKSRKKMIRSFFGYDPVDGHYKLLCMSKKAYRGFHAPSYEHQVFTLGGAHKSWKMIECNIHHRPKTNGVCINGVVYYGAVKCKYMSLKREWCLARFDVRSETFDQVVQFLGDHGPPSLVGNLEPYLISYKEKVTLAFKNKSLTRYELWVLEDAERHEWSKVYISFLHHFKNPFMWHNLHIGGYSSHTGEIVFVAQHKKHQADFYVVYYDHKKDSIRINKIGETYSNEFSPCSVMVPLLNYVESAMLL